MKPKQLKTTIGGIDFTFQHPGIRKVLQMSDSSMDPHGNRKLEVHFSQLMEHVIVEPKTNWDFWDEHSDIMGEVYNEVNRFL